MKSKKIHKATSLPSKVYAHKETMELIEILNFDCPTISKMKFNKVYWGDVKLDLIDMRKLKSDYVYLGEL